MLGSGGIHRISAMILNASPLCCKEDYVTNIISQRKGGLMDMFLYFAGIALCLVAIGYAMRA